MLQSFGIPNLPDRAMPYDAQTPPQHGRKRVAVFASYSSDGYLPPQVMPYLHGLSEHTDAIVVVCDNDLAEGERERLECVAAKVITGRHGEYDFGSYKRGIEHAKSSGLLAHADDLILCNDSCFGPIVSFGPMFETMDARGLDFWGATDSHEFSYHLQSYWVVLTRRVFESAAFAQFFASVKKQPNVQQVIMNYELGLTKRLNEAGFSASAMVAHSLRGCHPKDPSYNNLTMFPLLTMESGLPLIKVKALRSPHTNADGANRVLSRLREIDAHLYDAATYDIDIKRFEDADLEAFSIIMPTRNRAHLIKGAIDSVLGQTHSNFELIVVDDGSTDGTNELLHREYDAEIKSGRLKYVQLSRQLGVCQARNVGLGKASNPWIAYADSDNKLRPYYLTLMANTIVANRDRDSFYARIINVGTGVTVGRPFSRPDLLLGNFVDLGVFVHKRSLVSQFGGFDPELKRLVDWDLIIRMTGHKDALFVPRVCLEYADADIDDRISKRESFASALVAIHRKHGVKPTITTAIVSYNHEKYLVEAIESALAQKGDFTHEILLSDDGSSDGSHRIIEHYANKYPKTIRNIGRDGNFGISSNYRHCFQQASGNKIAILEGDDYWIDDEKLLKQASFLRKHLDAVMVFSKIEAFDTLKNTHRLLKRQMGLPTLLTGEYFSKNEHLNLIANLSSAMFRKQIVMTMPRSVYMPRLNEICLSFYMDRLGKIGFIDQVMSIYRQNPASVWTGADKVSQLKQSIAIRESALRIARPIYHAHIRSKLDQKRADLIEAEGALKQSADAA